jgi:transposase
LVREQPALAKRMQQLSESAHRKLGPGASAALGVRGKARLRAVAAGETAAEQLSHRARRPRQRQQPPWPQALEGRFTQAPRGILAEWLAQYAPVAAALQRAEARIRQEGENRADPCGPEAVPLLDTIPGVGETGAQLIVAESGVDLERFPTAHHGASGAGMGPDNHESAGTRKSGQTTKGSRYGRAALVQAAWAARHHKETYLAAPYKRLVKRRGKQKALVAVGPRMLVSAYHGLQTRTSSPDWGGDYFERRHVDKQRKRLIRQLESLGLKVTVEEVKEAA